MINWIKRHKFWTGITVALVLDIALSAAGVYTNIALLCGVATFIWFLFNMKKISWWLWVHLFPYKGKTKEAK